MMHGVRKLVTIVTEAGLERELVTEIETSGASGYTVSDARGCDSRGRRSASWEHNTNIRIEILCDTELAQRIVERLRTRYYGDYAMVMWLQDVAVFRPEKFV